MRAAAWLLGFIILFNPYLVPGAESAPRLTDLVGAGLWALLAARLLTGRTLHLPTLARLGMVVALVLLWALRDAARAGLAPDVAQVRWILAAAHGYFLWLLARGPATRKPLVLGLGWGAVANLGVVALQGAGMTDLTVALGLASPRFESRWALVGGVVEVRPFGMWGHPNASSGVIALCLPLVLGLVDEGRLGARWIVAGLGVTFLGSALTLTRSGMLVGALLLGVWALGGRQTPRQRMARLSVVLLLAAVGAAVGPPGGWERWTDSRTASNRGERLHATLGSLDLAFANPAGLGAGYQETLLRTVGIPATHNAWMYLALLAGLPLALLVLAAVAGHALSLARRRSVEAWLALAMLGLFLFEEYFRATAFQILALWLVATPTGLLRRVRVPAPAAPAPAAPNPAAG